jgi:hypothetical protein
MHAGLLRGKSVQSMQPNEVDLQAAERTLSKQRQRQLAAKRPVQTGGIGLPYKVPSLERGWGRPATITTTLLAQRDAVTSRTTTSELKLHCCCVGGTHSQSPFFLFDSQYPSEENGHASPPTTARPQSRKKCQEKAREGQHVQSHIILKSAPNLHPLLGLSYLLVASEAS